MHLVEAQGKAGRYRQFAREKGYIMEPAHIRYQREFEERKLLQKPDKRQLTRRYVIQVKAAAVCADCKIDYPHYILEFDHVRGTKIGDINVLAREGCMTKLQEEIDKCDIVCSNCHGHRTWMRSAATPRPVR